MSDYPLTNYRVTGNHVEHLEWPRFEFDFRPINDGTGAWENGPLTWIDNPAAGPIRDKQELTSFAAHLVRRAGDAWREHREAEAN